MIESRRFWVSEKARLREIAELILHLDVGECNAAEIIIRPPKKEKSTAQRGYWHVLLDDFAKSIGHSPREMKEIVKQEYYGSEVVTLPTGQKYEILPSSEDEDRAGYGRLIDFTLQMAAEQGISLQDPRPPL